MKNGIKIMPRSVVWAKYFKRKMMMGWKVGGASYLVSAASESVLRQSWWKKTLHFPHGRLCNS